MLTRKIERLLLQWKSEKNHKPLVIKGCRQCGKTYSVLQFGRQHYKHVVYLNFFQDPAYRDIFSGSLKVDTLTMLITALLGQEAVFEAHHTLLILDEIQECPEARTALKFFQLDGRYDVIATGSLLGVAGYGHAPRSIPVGYETLMNMYPLDFEEFLWANGINQEIIQYLQTCLLQKSAIPAALHDRMRQLLHEYTVIGGMPDIVQTYIRTKDMNQILHMQRDIVQAYKDDMVKYAPSADKAKIKECFESIPKQLGKENKKFQYSLIRKGARSSQYAGSLHWIEDAGIITRCYNVYLPELPLDGNADLSSFKVYMCDTGLFTSMLEDGSQYDILQGRLFGYKGAIFENLAADIFHKMGRKLYYFKKDSGLEIDFLIRLNGACVPVEVKASTGNIKSTKTILKHPEKYHIYHAVKLGDYNIGEMNNILTLPFYLGFLLTAR